MQKNPKETERDHLVEALYRKYAHSRSLSQRFVYWRKKYSWLIVVKATALFKRLFDIIFSLILLILFSPIMLFIMLLIKLTDGGPIFYVSQRVGKWGKEFPFPKFRSMQLNADKMKENLIKTTKQESSVTFKMAKDPRVTWIGKIIRKTSLDELPQLWSVIKGDMSLVGPRPPLPKEVDKYTIEQRRRLDVVPGITGIWQVSGRSNIPFTGQVKLDLEYIESQSFWLDIKLLLKTIPAVLLGRGAY